VRISAVLAVAMLVTAGPFASNAVGRSRDLPTHCGGKERVVYSCQFGRKTGSVCLAKSSLRYAFGPIGKPELNLVSAPDWSNVRIHRLYSAALAQAHVRISNGPTSYIVYFGETGQLAEAPGRRISGITVADQNGKELAGLSCKSGARIDSSAFGDMARSAPRHWQGEEQPDGPFDVYF
jgi:hypothetical protein